MTYLTLFADHKIDERRESISYTLDFVSLGGEAQKFAAPGGERLLLLCTAEA